MTTTVISTADAPAPMPAFSQGLRKGPLLQVSRQGAVASVEDVIMFRVYLTAREHFPALNEAYQEFLAEHVPSGRLPCRTTVFVQLPHETTLVEIDALAVVS